MSGAVRLVLLAVAALVASGAGAAGGHALMHADIDLGDRAALQRGARLFVNYCMGCHSAQYQRYNRLARDLGIPEKVVQKNLIFTRAKLGDTMQIAMRQDDAARWFGTAPPDLSVIARARGADWLYTYFKTFYLDASRPTGVNNVAFPDTAMPHVLWELEGLKRAVIETETDEQGVTHRRVAGFEMVRPGKLDADAYDAAVRDLVSFLVYLGEPAKLVRYRIGVWVLLYLVLFTLVAWLLKREYWRDVH